MNLTCRDSYAELHSSLELSGSLLDLVVHSNHHELIHKDEAAAQQLQKVQDTDLKQPLLQRSRATDRPT